MTAAKKYVIATYLTFWLMVLGICGTASMVFHAPPLVMRVLSNVCAWSPTIVLFVMFKKLLPGMTRVEFLRKSFSGRINPVKLLTGCWLTVCCILLSVSIAAVIEKREVGSYFAFGNLSALPLSVLLSLTSGPTGEELGWRGYLKGELEKKPSFVGSAVRLGTIWAFWHAVLWFVDSDFSGWAMLVYIISNVIVMISLTLIMGIVMGKGGNVLCSMAIHFCFNCTYLFLNVGIVFYAVLTVAFALVAAVMTAIYARSGE